MMHYENVVISLAGLDGKFPCEVRIAFVGDVEEGSGNCVGGLHRD